MQHYDVILFDVDGTLIDSDPGILNTLEEVFTKMGEDVTHVTLRRYLGPPLRKSLSMNKLRAMAKGKDSCRYRTKSAHK